MGALLVPSRPLYSTEELRPLLAPHSVAIVGVSSRPSSFGRRTWDNLVGSDIEVFGVHPGRIEIDGRPTYASAAELPKRPDCAVIAVPREAVEEAVLDCARAGIRGALVFASGYAETGRPEHAELQRRLTSIAREYGIRILGPNCMGILGGLAGMRLTFGEAPALRVDAAAIGLVSQSGGMGFAMAQASEHGQSFSHVFTSGNACDVDIADQISFLVDQPECRVIACMFEGMPDPLRLIAAGERALAAGKPVVIFKIAVGEEGREAAMSHTGSMAGSTTVYRAAFEHCGFVEVTDFEALVETAAFFAKAGRPSSDGVAALATSGGAAIMVADKAELHGVALPQPDAEVAALLRSHIPEFGSARNPCDVTAQILNTPEAMPACARALLKSPEFSALVIPHPYAYASGTQRLQALAAVGSECGKPVCCVWLSQWLEEPGATVVERLPGMALFRSMDRCMRALKAWHQRERFLQQRAPADPGRRVEAASRRAAADLLASAPGELVTEGDAKRALALYGVPVVEERLVQDADAAVQAATALGFPVVLKVESPDIPHKTEAGGVALGLAHAGEVREAFARVAHAVQAARPQARILGYLVQPMLARDLELIVGAKRDPSFGPVVVVGLGGVLAELLDDSVASLAPVSTARALQMLDHLRGRALLDGFRGSAPVDRTALAEVICRISEFAADHADRVAELDVNPLVVSNGRVIAVDALISLSARRQED